MIRKIFAYLSLALVITACSEDDPSDAGDPGSSGELTNATSVENTSGEVYRVGFDQQSSNNQNPFVEKVDAQGDRLWRVNHETTGVDGRAPLVALDQQENPWVVFTVDGGSNSGDFINQRAISPGAFNDVFANSYGRGGGPVASILARLDPATGSIVKGTFVTARLTNGNTNTLRITALGFVNGNVTFEATSAAWPPGTGSSYMRMPSITDADRVNGSFELYYEITGDLSEIQVARLR